MQSLDTSRPKYSSSRPLNEIAHVAIALPDDTSFYSEPKFIAVAFVSTAGGGYDAEILAASRRYLPFLARYEIFSALCNDRAIRTVDGELLVEGKSITPERYLACWRVSIAHPLSPV